MKSNDSILIIHDIRSAHNVGSLFRTADAVGISHIFLSSVCPLPIDRFGRPVKEIAKTALGAEKTIPWSSYKTIEEIFTTLKQNAYTIIAIEQSSDSVDYKKIPAYKKNAFIIGNEVTGIPESILKQVNHIAEIPMSGNKESLNVSVAAGVALFRILDR